MIQTFSKTQDLKMWHAHIMKKRIQSDFSSYLNKFGEDFFTLDAVIWDV